MTQNLSLEHIVVIEVDSAFLSPAAGEYERCVTMLSKVRVRQLRDDD